MGGGVENAERRRTCTPKRIMAFSIRTPQEGAPTAGIPPTPTKLAFVLGILDV